MFKLLLILYIVKLYTQIKIYKRDSVSAYVHMKFDTPLPLYASVNILDDPLPFP